MLATLPKTRLIGFLLLSVALASCASARKKDEIRLAEYQGRKVALVAVEGEATQVKMCEVALVNQLLQTGTFELIGKKEVEAAKAGLETDTTSPLSIAKQVGADLALEARVLEMSAEEKEGFSKVAIDDSLLKAERGDGKDERVYKVKSLTGKVKVELSFTNVKTQERKTGTASALDVVVAEERVKAAHLPPRLRFLEDLTNRAFQDFFRSAK